MATQTNNMVLLEKAPGSDLLGQHRTIGSTDDLVLSPATVAIAPTGNVSINSTGGSLSMGDAASTQAINIGTAGARVITLGQGVGVGPTIVLNGSTNTTIIESMGALSIGSTFTGSETVNLASVSGGALGYVRTLNIGSSNTTSANNIYAGSGGTNVFGPFAVASTTNAISLTSTTGAITIDGTTTGTINLGAAGGTGTINIGTTASARTISINNGVAGAINIGNNAASTGTVNIVGSTATGARAVNIATGGTGAKTLTMGEGTVAGSVTDIVGGSSNGVRVNNNINSPVTLNGGTSTGTITLGGSAAQTIAIGTGAAAKTVTLGSINTTSATTLQAGTGKMYAISASGVVFGNSGSSAYSPVGIRVANNSGGALAEGDIIVCKTTATQASGAPDVIKAVNNVVGSQGFAGVALGAISNAANGDAASVPGTICKVTFASAPSAGDSGKPVYLSATAGQATMTAPSASGSRVFVIGYLTSSTAASGSLYYVQLMPQFIADIP